MRNVQEIMIGKLYPSFSMISTIIILFIFGTLLSRGVKINKLQVPQVIQHGSPVILDCDFTLSSEEKGLVLKWYKNQSLVYQWIPEMKMRPQDLGPLKGRLNLDHEASVDANSIYRALHILKPGPDLSGDYTCKVSTFQSEDESTKNMLVFVPEKSLGLKRMNANESAFKVQCSAEGVFPIPVMTLRSQEREIEEAEVSVRERGVLFDITASTILPALEAPEEFTCELHIPQANYTVRKETVFYPGISGSTYHKTNTWTFVVLLWSYLQHNFIGVC